MNMNSDPNDTMVDLDQNCASLKISRDIYIRILSKAMDQTKQDIKDFEEALPIDEFDRIQAITHRWKGDYDNMRIKYLSNIAHNMNNLVRAVPQDKEKLSLLLEDFRVYFKKLQKFIGN